MSKSIGIVLQGGLYNSTLRAMELLGCADTFGNSAIPLYVLNATYPLVPEEWVKFCSGKRRCWWWRRGSPSSSSRRRPRSCTRTDVSTRIVGKEVLPRFGEYTVDALRTGISRFHRPMGAAAAGRWQDSAGP